MPDVSLVLALHREGHYVPRTLLSLAEAASYAAGFDISVELIAVLDRPDSVTEAVLRNFDFSAFQSHIILRADNGSLGPTRNDGCRAASGTYILTADGDDLISFNTIVQMKLHAERAGPEAILIPNFIFAFGGSYHVAEYFNLDAVTPLSLLTSNPFVSRVFFHRSVLDCLSYQDVSLNEGYAFEDWMFNCEAVALGFEFHAVPETILFYRQRAGSLLDRGNRTSVGQPPPSRLFRTDHYRRVAGPWVSRLMQEGDFRPATSCKGKSVLRNQIYLELLVAANAIEPAILPDRLQTSPYVNYLGADIASGVVYYRLCEWVGDWHFDEVFLLPFMAAGGADRYILDIIRDICQQDPSRRILVVFGEALYNHFGLERLPAACLSVDLASFGRELGPEQRDLLCLKLIQSCAESARLHLRASPFGHRFFSRFAQVLRKHRPVLYRFSDIQISYSGFTFTEPWTFEFISEHIDFFGSIICDSARIKEADQRRLQDATDRWKVLPARMDVPDSLDQTAAEWSLSSRRILWTSRIDSEKRPELLITIARLMARRLPDVVLDIFGRPTLGNFDVSRFASMKNVRYKGFFERFEDLEVDRHYCFLYTSWFDGVPIVLLEMAAAGLPIIAPDVGSIGEFIRNKETGVLLDCTGDDEADAELYVEAIEALFANPGLWRTIRQQGFDAVKERSAPEKFSSRIAEIFGGPTPPGEQILQASGPRGDPAGTEAV